MAQPPATRIMPHPTPSWPSLPRELLHLCFRQLAGISNSGERGLGLREARQLMAALSVSREWRAVALAEMQLRLRVESAAELDSPLLRTLCCIQLELPDLHSQPPHARGTVQKATIDLLTSPAFQHCSGGCLAGLLGVPLAVAAAGCLAAFGQLRHLTLADSARQGAGWWEEAALVGPGSFPPCLQSLQLPARLLGAGLADHLPASLQHLVLLSAADMVLGAPAFHPRRACHTISAEAGRTATVLLDALAACKGCRELAIKAHWITLSSPNPNHCTSLAPAVLYGTPPPPLATSLPRWLAVLAPILSSAGIQHLHLTAWDVSLYCRSTGRLAGLHPGRWRQPGILQIAAHGLLAQLTWPVAALPPAYFSLSITRQAQ